MAVDLTYAYTARGQISSIDDQSPANIDQTFTYDGAARLTASTGPWGAGTFTYDAIGNLVQRQVGSRVVAMTYNATSNRLTSHTDTVGGPRSLSYDARGNVTALGGLGFTYDASNQPVAVSGPAAGTYAYDGHLRRVKQVVGGVTRYSVYDVSGGLVSIDQVGAGPTEYIRASGMTLARVAGAAVTWLHPDHLGSAVAGTGPTGAVAWRESEQPFGEDWISAPANDNLAGYTGHVEDAATGLVYMQARYYDPVIGRFLANDPVGFSPGRPDMFNRYAYAANDPVNAVDPHGKQTHILVVNNRKEFVPGGEHSAIYIKGRNGKPGVLFDPGGSFVPSDYEGERGSSAFFTESPGQNLLNEFIEYETLGPRVLTDTVVETSEAEEAAIIDRTGGQNGRDPGPLNCASSCSAVTRGVGPFKDEGKVTPGGVQKNAQNAAKAAGGHQVEYKRKSDSSGPQGNIKKRWEGKSEN